MAYAAGRRQVSNCPHPHYICVFQSNNAVFGNVLQGKRRWQKLYTSNFVSKENAILHDRCYCALSEKLQVTTQLKRPQSITKVTQPISKKLQLIRKITTNRKSHNPIKSSMNKYYCALLKKSQLTTISFYVKICYSNYIFLLMSFREDTSFLIHTFWNPTKYP